MGSKQRKSRPCLVALILYVVPGGSVACTLDLHCAFTAAPEDDPTCA